MFQDLNEVGVLFYNFFFEEVEDVFKEIVDGGGVEGFGGVGEEVGLEFDPKPGEGLGFLEDDDFIPGGVLGVGTGVVVGAHGVGGVDGDDGDVVGVVVLVGAKALSEFLHVAGCLGVVGDDGVGFSEGDPGEEEVAVAVDVGGISSAGGEVDAASEEADVGALGVVGVLEELVFAEIGEAGLADGVGDGGFGAMPEGKDFGGSIGIFSLIGLLDGEGRIRSCEGAEAVDDFLS